MSLEMAQKVIGPQKKIYVPQFLKQRDINSYSAYYFLKVPVHLHNFSKIKSQEVKNSRNQGFPYYFCMTTEGSGSVPLTNGSGSRRPKNIRIRRICIRIRNAAFKASLFH